MSALHVNDVVRLTADLPELSLHRGVMGVVRSTWFEPATRYDVEFLPDEDGENTRALVRPEQVELQPGERLASMH